MYSRFQLAIKYCNYYLKASNGKGHGVHSPFVFDFIKFVLNDKKRYEAYQQIEKIRNKLLKDKTKINVEDFGAGSSVIKNNKRAISEIASSSLKQKKYSQLLYRIVKYYKPENIVELGTSLGITTSYLASASTHSKVYTLEGSENIAAVAEKNFQNLHLKNTELIKGNFDNTLQSVLEKINKIDLAFVDGNHRKHPTLQYFQQLLQRSTNDSIFIFDDIHWSIQMEEAWEEIKTDPSVTLTIDMFFIGFVFFKKEFKEKQHFVIRF